jgi:integrase
VGGIKLPKLTVIQLKALTPELAGAKIREEGGLIGTVKAKKSGEVSVYFDWRYRFAGKVRQLQIGTWPKNTLADIRKERDRLLAQVGEGLDPAALRETDRLSKQADQVEALSAQRARLAHHEAMQARLTVHGLFDRWEGLELARRKDGGTETRRCFEKDIFPTLGEVAAEDVTRTLIAASLDKVVARDAPIIARNLLGDLRQMFGFAIKRGLLEDDPTSHLKRDDFGKKVERDRVMSETEIRALHALLPDADMRDSSIQAIWIMLSTCCRVGEITQARVENIDLTAMTWRIPPENSKNGKEHTINLSEFALKHMRALVERAAGIGSPWLMPAQNKDGFVCKKSLAKQIGDRQRGADSTPMVNRTQLTNALALPGGKWTPHDLRRTGATLMGSLGVRPDVIEKCLNHVEQNRLIRIYQRQALHAEMCEAWRLLGERLDLLTRENVDNVITIDVKGKTAA